MRYGQLHVLEGTINAERYIKVLSNICSPPDDVYFRKALCISGGQCKPHTAAITTAWLCSRRVRVLIGLPAVQIFHL